MGINYKQIDFIKELKMKNVTVCDRDEAIIKVEDKSFKVTVVVENVKSGKKFEKSSDLCELCTGVVVRGVADRVFLSPEIEDEILKEIECQKAPKKNYSKKE